MDPRRTVFLTAVWRNLAMLNYEIDPVVLRPYVPSGTELDAFEGRSYLSLVGFLFLDTRVLGVPIPFHRNFEEVNLRFYVRRKTAGEWRRGVVFIREFVPRRAIAWTANVVYGENYLALPMAHAIERDFADQPIRVEYSWRHRGVRAGLRVALSGAPTDPAPGSLEEFITEHYWGYARQRDGRTVEYRVEHPRWRVWTATEARLEGEVALLYGAGFAVAIAGAPSSAFLAEGSAVTVSRGLRIN